MPEITSPTIEFISVANEFRHEYIVDLLLQYVHVVPKLMHKTLLIGLTKNFGMHGITALPML